MTARVWSSPCPGIMMASRTAISRTSHVNAIEKASQFVGKTFSAWVVLFACFGFFAPHLFTGLKPWITPLLGIVMFGMGLTLSTAEIGRAHV